jgi:predicted methyltransferase
MRKRWGWLALVAGAWLAAVASAQTEIEPNIAAAVADASRPPLDKFRDERRKPAQTLAFAGIKEGMKIAELIPGNGYYTRLLSKAVGPSGKVYTFPSGEPRTPLSAALAKNAAYTNIQYVPAPITSLAVPEPVDVVWTSQNYHDLRAQAATINKAVFAALKPGGTYLILDHAAKPGARNESVALHRIDEELVKQEVLAAGFVLDAQSDLLRNPKDDRARQVMERDLNRQTDQFVLRFRKPQS